MSIATVLNCIQQRVRLDEDQLAGVELQHPQPLGSVLIAVLLDAIIDLVSTPRAYKSTSSPSGIARNREIKFWRASLKLVAHASTISPFTLHLA